MSDSERKEIIKFAVKTVNKKAKIIAGTDITPFPPNDNIGIIWSSFPEYMSKFSLQSSAIFATCEIFPLASFIATIFFIFESFKQICGSILTPVLLGTLYIIIGIFTDLEIAL